MPITLCSIAVVGKDISLSSKLSIRPIHEHADKGCMLCILKALSLNMNMRIRETRILIRLYQFILRLLLFVLFMCFDLCYHRYGSICIQQNSTENGRKNLQSSYSPGNETGRSVFTNIFCVLPTAVFYVIHSYPSGAKVERKKCT